MSYAREFFRHGDPPHPPVRPIWSRRAATRLLHCTAAFAFLCSLAASPASAQRKPSTVPSPAQSPTVVLDRALARAFGGREGAGVVVDVKSGTILAARDLPLAAHRLALPGSTIKTFVLSILLESGRLRPAESFVCPFHLTIADMRLDCPHPEKLGQMSPAAALAWSCNNFFARMATRLSPLELARGLAHWGFASPTRLAGDERSGDIATVYTQPELELEALGEFGVHSTPLEVLQAYRRLALRRGSPAAQNPSLDVVFEGLEAGVRNGMASVARTDRLSVAGKTGTSRSEDSAGSHGWFAGYAPADVPEIALVIYVERGNGPADAAGIAHTLLSAWRDTRPRK